MMSENKMCEWSKYLQKTSSFSFMTCTSVFNQRCMPLGLKKIGWHRGLQEIQIFNQK